MDDILAKVGEDGELSFDAFIELLQQSWYADGQLAGSGTCGNQQLHIAVSEKILIVGLNTYPLVI